MKKLSLICLINLIYFLCFFKVSLAHFDQIVQEEQVYWLLQLNDPSLKMRMKATQTLLDFPQWSLPVIRKAIDNAQFKDIHWRLAYLLGVLGDPTDIPFLLKNTPIEEINYESKVWRGATERVYWRHRRNQSRKPILSRLFFRANQCQGSEITGKLIFRIVNPDREARLIRSRFDLLYARLQSSTYQSYHWVAPEQGIQVEVPLSLIVFPKKKAIRFDLKVEEVGSTNKISHLPRIEILSKICSDDPLL